MTKAAPCQPFVNSQARNKSNKAIIVDASVRVVERDGVGGCDSREIVVWIHDEAIKNHTV